ITASVSTFPLENLLSSMSKNPAWQYVFPAPNRAVARALEQTNIRKNASCHTFRHSKQHHATLAIHYSLLKKKAAHLCAAFYYLLLILLLTLLFFLQRLLQQRAHAAHCWLRWVAFGGGALGFLVGAAAVIVAFDFFSGGVVQAQ